MPGPGFRNFACVLLLCLGLVACRHEVVAPGDPVAAVKGLAAAVKDNDLVRYSRLSVPPALHEKMQARWKARLAIAPPPTEAQKQDYARLMGRFTAPDAEARLYRSLDPKLKKLEKEIGSQWPLMQTTARIFVTGLIQANDRLSPSEKDHAKAVGAALMAWAQPKLVTDRARARQAIAVMTATARELDLPTLETTRELEMVPALEKGNIVLKGLKQMGRVYGLDADASLAGMQAELVGAEGDLATVQVRYPLLGKTVSFELELIRRDNRWYRADAVRSAEAELARPLTATAP